MDGVNLDLWRDLIRDLVLPIVRRMLGKEPVCLPRTGHGIELSRLFGAARLKIGLIRLESCLGGKKKYQRVLEKERAETSEHAVYFFLPLFAMICFAPEHLSRNIHGGVRCFG